MKTTSEINLYEFEFWSGAKTNAETFTKKEMDELEYHIEELYTDGITDTQLNDLFWFDYEWLCGLVNKEIVD